MNEQKYEIQLIVNKAPIEPATYSLFFNPAGDNLQEHLNKLRLLQYDDSVSGKTGEDFITVEIEQNANLAYHFDELFGTGMASEVFKYCGLATLIKIINEVDKGVLFYNNELESRRRIVPVKHYEETQNEVNSHSSRYNKHQYQQNAPYSNHKKNTKDNVQLNTHTYYSQPIKRSNASGCLTVVIVIFIVITLLVSVFIHIL